MDGENISSKPRGVNFKYRNEFTQKWGVIGSVTTTKSKFGLTLNDTPFADAKLQYFSVAAGPTWRINDYASVYGLVGYAHGKAKMYINSIDYQYSDSTGAFLGGLGAQFNVTPNIVVDASWEYSKLDDFRVNT